MAGFARGGVRRAHLRLRAAVLAAVVVGCVVNAGAALATPVQVAGGVTGAPSVHQLPTVNNSTATEYNSLQCVSRTFCVATGNDERGVRLTRWNGSSWQFMPTPSTGGNPHEGYGELNGVSCSSSTSCLAVGANPCTGPLDEAWNGRAWALTPAPFPGPVKCSVSPGTPVGSLSVVSCATSRFCMAAGEIFSGSRVVFERWNGKGFSRLPGPPKVSVVSLSCVAADACAAAGHWQGGTAVAWWNGQRWSEQLAHNGFDSRNVSGMDSVSCGSRSFCIAVGTTGSDEPLALEWTGAGWRTVSAGARSAADGSASCTAHRACFSTIGYFGAPIASNGIDRWIGSGWVAPTSVGTPSDFLGLISCVPGPLCTTLVTLANNEPGAFDNFRP